MMSVSAHDRIAGALRAKSLKSLCLCQNHPGAVFMRKDEIARFALSSPQTIAKDLECILFKCESSLNSLLVAMLRAASTRGQNRKALLGRSGFARAIAQRELKQAASKSISNRKR